MDKWNSKVQFPTDSNFINRVTHVEHGPSKSSGNPMITLVCEVVSPTDTEIAGKKYNIAGVETTNYFVTQTVNGKDEAENEERTKDNRARLTDPTDGLFVKLGLPMDNIPWDNLTPYLQPLMGKLILTQMSPDVEPMTKNPTQAQIDAARAQNPHVHIKNIKGDVQKHPITGAQLINYWPKVREIFGLAPAQDGQSRPF